MNIDLRNNPPSVDLLYSLGVRYARFVYDVSWEAGSLDFDRAYNLYAPYIDRLLARGIRPIVVLNHETWGEGRGYDFGNLNDEFLSRWIATLNERVIARFIHKGLWWQVWNEQDHSSVAAVGLRPEYYGKMLRMAYQNFRSVDPSCRIVTGGFVAGPGSITRYCSRMGANWQQYCHYIAIHEYGSDTASIKHPISSTGLLQPKIREWKRLGKPLLITEWGVTTPTPDALPEQVVTDYAGAFTAVTRKENVPALWFAWAFQHDATPVIRRDGTVKASLASAIAHTGQLVITEPVEGKMNARINAIMNIRSSPNGALLPQTISGNVQVDTDKIAWAGRYWWVFVTQNGRSGWVALLGVNNITGN